MLHHIVIWTLYSPADAPRFQQLLGTCAALVPGTRAFHVGVRTDGLEANADVVLVSAFDDAAALAAYQAHPVHQAVLPELGALRKTRHVVDFETP